MREPTLSERVNGSPALRRRQLLGRVLVRTLGRPALAGVEVSRTPGPLILAINHRSLLDGPLVFGYVARPVTCLVKAEALTPSVAGLLLSAGQVPVSRDAVDRRPVRLCLDVLHAGGVVGIFPEGTRGAGMVTSAKPGVGYLALRTGAAVVPVACAGTDQMAHRTSGRRPRVRLVFGSPIRVERHPVDRLLNRRLVAETTEHIRLALAKLVHAADGAHAGEPEGLVA